MAKHKEPDPPVRVYPHPDLAPRGEYLAGVGLDGVEVSADLAAEWLAAGLATDVSPADKE